MDESVHIVWSIVVGFIVGLIASAIMHTHLGFVGTTLLGIVGSVGSVQLTASTKTGRDLREDRDGRKSGRQETADTTHR
jgi:uncharacterized membrane protein YeaQ/YmgE (transglycosylase-associated protein family)